MTLPDFVSCVFEDAERGIQVFGPTVLLRPEEILMDHDVRVDSFVKIEGGQGVLIGRDVHIASFAHVNIGGGQTVIGDHVAISSGVKVISGQNHPDAIPEFIVGSALVQRGQVRIENDVIIFAGAIILPGVRLGQGCRIAAGAVVAEDVPPFEIWCGVPARKKRSVHPEYAQP